MAAKLPKVEISREEAGNCDTSMILGQVPTRHKLPQEEVASTRVTKLAGHQPPVLVDSEEVHRQSS
jgi:hypothetical protein